MEKLQVSSVEEIQLTATELVELPVIQNRGDKPFVMRLVAPSFEAIFEYYRGMPRMGRSTAEIEAAVAAGEASEEQKETIPEMLEREMRKLLELGAATEPEISFEAQEQGKIWWPQLHLRNRGFLVRRIAALSGTGPGSKEGERIATFPPREPRGGEGGAPAPGAVPNGAGPA